MRPNVLEKFQTFVDQRLADAFPLLIRSNGDWAQAIPSVRPIADCNSGKGDMTDDATVLDGN